MPKNKNKPNGFLLFMLEWKKKEEKKGRKFPNALKDVQMDPVCNEEWRNLDKDEKEYYKCLAKNDKTNYSVNAKRTGLGDLISDIDKKKMKEEEFHDNMKEYIYALINTAKHNKNIHRLKFYAIHINFFYSRTLENNENEYYPAEISIVEFSLEAGILRKYHQIINEKIRLGYSSAAKIHSNDTHQIPVNAEFGKSDYKEIFKDICEFLEPQKEGGKYPVLYTFFLKEEVHLPVKFVLDQLGIADGKPSEYLRLYSLEHLFASIYNASIRNISTISMDPTRAKLELGKDPFIYKTGLECEYHGLHKAGVIHCSQSIVIRWIYVIYKFCCPQLKISLIAGVHYPKENPDSIDVELVQSSFNSLSLNSSRYGSSYSLNSTVNSDFKYGRNKLEKNVSKTEHGLKPIEIIDHSKINKTSKAEEVTEQPLRLPRTKSVAGFQEYDENRFPSIGRGKMK